MRILSLLILSLLLEAPAAIAQQKFTEQQKIDHLIAYVRSLHDATFIRNGKEYKAADAADHLQMKREKAGKRLKTTEEFITRIASKSMLSGDPYMIRLANGKEYACEMLLRLELKKLNEGRSKLLTK
jgi:hypothetical protein